MRTRTFPWPEHRWDIAPVSIRETGGPQRVVTDQPDPDFIPRPIGFAPPQPKPIERDPQLWEGDNA